MAEDQLRDEPSQQRAPEGPSGSAETAEPPQAVTDDAGLTTLQASLAQQLELNQSLEKSLKEVETRLEQTRSQLGEATEAYRKLAFALHPDIPAELIAGASVPEIDSSVEKAVALVEKIMESLGKQIRGPVPTGAPVRSAPDYSSLSPRDKIKAGLGRRS